LPGAQKRIGAPGTRESIHMTTAEPAPPTDAVVAQRARARTFAQRRKRLWQRVALLVAVTIAMVLAVLFNRDTQHLRGERKLGQMIADELQKEFGGRRDPSLMFPSGRDPREAPLAQELKELNDEIRESGQEGPEQAGAIAQLERKRDEVARELQPLVRRREEFERQRKRHYFNMFYVSQWEPRSEREVGVCCLEKPVRFFLRTEGRIVILFDGKNYSSHWMPESEFRAKAQQLGFGNLLKEYPSRHAPPP
jgi:hypothetical protein